MNNNNNIIHPDACDAYMHARAHMHARTHALTHTHARTHARTHAHTHTAAVAPHERAGVEKVAEAPFLGKSSHLLQYRILCSITTRQYVCCNIECYALS